MYDYSLHQQLNTTLQELNLEIAGGDNLFYTRFMANIASIAEL